MRWTEGINQFFKREPRYAFLTLIVIAFFLANFLIQWISPAHETVPVSARIQEMEKTMQANSQNPAYLEARFKEAPELGWLFRAFSLGGVVALVIGFYLNLGLMQKWMRKEPWLPPRVFGSEVRWGMEDVVKAVILACFVGICLNLLLVTIHHLAGVDFSDHNVLVITHTTLIDLFIFGLVLLVIRDKQGKMRIAFGFRKPAGYLHEMGLGIKAYFVILPYFLMVLIALLVLMGIFAYEPPPHPLVGVFIEEEKRAPWLVAYSLVLACVFGPVVEEVFFRGFFYPALRSRYGVRWAMVITAVLFALIHESWFALIPVFLLGLALAHLYEKRGNLLSCITLHILHNSIFISYFFLMKAVLFSGGRP